MEKRVLPPRSNRGKRPPPSQEQNVRDDMFYNQFFQRAANAQPEPAKPKPKMQQKIDSCLIQQKCRQMYMLNRTLFPYSRSYHYFYDLTDFPRVSPSYAVDQSNVFQATYLQQNKIINNDLTVGNLFNRTLFGMPICLSSHMSVRTRDKNLCHAYLFQNENRKFYIDQSSYELKQILKNFQMLEETGKINNFSCLKKDIDLLAILQDELSTEQKKNILRKKIKILSQKKQSMKNSVLLEDKNFFYHSLNQKLHNDIQDSLHQLTLGYMLGQIQFSNVLRQKVQNCQQQQKISALGKLFSYYKLQRSCLQEQTIDKMVQKLNQRFFQKQQTQQNQYLVSIPFIFLNFSSQNIMTVSQKILALKLLHQSEASFYICKIFWKRVFGRDLIINKELKIMSKSDYDKAMTTSMTQLIKWKKQHDKQQAKNNTQNQLGPLLDSLIDWNVFSTSQPSFNLFSVEPSVEITARQYICLCLFSRLYNSLTQIYEFIMNNQVLSELIANQFFSKSHSLLTEVVGSVQVGLLQQILKKLAESIIRQQIQVEWKYKCVYKQDLGVAYIIRQGLEEEWESQQANSNSKPLRQRKPDQEQKQILEQSMKKRFIK